MKTVKLPGRGRLEKMESGLFSFTYHGKGGIRKDREWAFLIHLSWKGVLEKIESKLGTNNISYSTIGGSSRACSSRIQR